MPADYQVDEYVALHLLDPKATAALAKDQQISFTGTLDRSETSFTAKNMYGVYVMYGLYQSSGKRTVGISLHEVKIKAP